MDPARINNTYILTTADIKSLKTADNVTFIRTPTRSYILAYKPVVRDDVETNFSVPTGSRVNAYDNTDAKYCSLTITNARNIFAPWRTIVNLMRKGDRLVAEWTRDVDRSCWKLQHGVSVDRLRLWIIRGPNDNPVKMLFDVETRVNVQSDESRRMVRVER